jgi:hypothetical protein
MINVITVVGLGKETADPIATGLFELKAGAKAGEYWLNPYKLEGRLATMNELFNTPIGDLERTLPASYASQAAIFVQYLRQRIDEASLHAGLSAAELAQLAGVSEQELARGYEAFLKERVIKESLLSRPEWVSQVDMTLVVAMDRRATAGAAGNLGVYEEMTTGDIQANQAQWLKDARGAGLTAMESSLIDMRVKDGSVTVLALERYQSSAGWVSAVVSQTWQKQDGSWRLTSWTGPAAPFAPWTESTPSAKEVK